MNGKVVKPEYKRDMYKLVRSPIIQLAPKQKLHISNQTATIDQDIFVSEEQLGKIFQGHYTVYVNGMFDRAKQNLVIESRETNQGW
jgi:hypothetical protein